MGDCISYLVFANNNHIGFDQKKIPTCEDFSIQFPGHKVENLEYFFIHTSYSIIPVLRFFREDFQLTMLYSHGNAEHIHNWPLIVRCLNYHRMLKVNVICFEYTVIGYGLSEGREVSEETVYEDIICVWNNIQSLYNLTPEELIICGRSLGSAPALYLASQLPNLHCLFLHSPILSVLQTKCGCCIPYCCKCQNLEMFQTSPNASLIQCPTLICHGLNDYVVPCNHSQVLHHIISSSQLYLFEQCGHNNLEIVHRDLFHTRHIEFLQQNEHRLLDYNKNIIITLDDDYFEYDNDD